VASSFIEISSAFVIGVGTNYLFRFLTYFFGSPKLEMCKYLIKTTNKKNIPSLQFKIINKSHFAAIDVELSLRAVKYKNDDKSLKEITLLSTYKIDYLHPKPFFKNKYFHNAYRGNFIHKAENIHELVNSDKIDEVEIFIKAINIFNNSLNINYVTIPSENIKDYKYEFNLGDKCQSPTEIDNKTFPSCELSKKELLKQCPFLNNL
jgi:hypothetical protein